MPDTPLNSGYHSPTISSSIFVLTVVLCTDKEPLNGRLQEMNIPRITLIYAILLIVLGLWGYFASGAASITALIPAFFGLVFLPLGILAKRENLKKHITHVGLLLALIAVIGTVGAVGKGFSLWTGEMMENSLAIISKSIMAVLSIGYLLVCIKSFIDARRK